MNNDDYDRIESPKSRKSRIRELFDSIDSDNSGNLSIDELQLKFSQLASTGAGGASAALKYAQGIMEVADADGDGFVDFDEFFNYIEAQEKSLFQLFCSIDESQDGSIQPEELVEALKKQGLNAKEKDVKRFLEHINSDDDDSISWQEFRDFFSLNPHSINLLNSFAFYQEIYSPTTPGFDLIILPPTGESKGIRWRFILASAVSGMASKSCTAPLDRVRTFLQLGGGGTKSPGKATLLFSKTGRAELIKVMKDSITTISKDGGLIQGLWKGNGINIIKTVPESLTRMLVLGRAKVLVAQFENVGDGISISPAGRFLAGAAGGAASTIVCYPLDVIRIRTMANIPRDATVVIETPKKPPTSRSFSTFTRSHFIPLKSYSTSTQISSRWSKFLAPFYHHGTFDMINQMWKEEGYRAFYKGLGASLMSIIPFAGTNLMVFESLKARYMRMNPDVDRPTIVSILGMGCIAGAVSETLVYPLHVLRARMSSQNTQTNPERYKNTWDCAKKLWLRDGGGIHNFYRGILPTLAKAAPGIGVAFSLFELSLRVLLPDTQHPIPR